ncbi:hypothetical protein HDG34_005679 [Paraburkholderia sp. HC6.4b]|uniref:hypothetical protein n=1 Tax=unclassified Paraburkholderia TaxID=2615204 RepID=UPI001618ADBA|nr:MULTISPECIES: hypothetical protein [unclassified Paraburkholderia]MBB5411718.1 hypothetical protein [Paraburkholderia sp. HC6.4b]MBB5453253.1 hypothetical protein [Paraburkholderia sp. Kb1A]
MDRYWQANAVEDAPETPADNPGGFPANGNPAAGVTGTVPGEWWYHAITEELRNAIIALGGTPDFTQVNQLADVLVESFAKTVSTITGSLATVATTGSYHDLTDQPVIPPGQVNSDWNADSGIAAILNRPAIPAAQVNADWNAESGVAAILNRPDIPAPQRGSTLLAATVYSVVAQSVTFSAGSPVITCSLHSPLTGSPVTFSSTDSLPGSIAQGATYFVVQVSADQSTFQISDTQGGAPISMTNAGTGTHSIGNPPWRKSDHSPAMVETALQGGGGSGGVASRTSNAGTATGGGAGGYVWLRRSADSLPDELDIGIGKGGTVPASGNAGSPGYLTHLGDLRSPLAVATGGAGGSGSATNAVLLGAPGGTGSGGDLNLRGEGSLPVVSTTASNYTAGGRSMFGTAGMGGVYGPSGATPVHDATGRGAGGGGGTGLPGSYNAGNGSDGLLIMREYS